MIGFTDLLNAQPEVFGDAADHWDQLAKKMDDHHQQWHAQVRDGLHSSGWTGPAGDAARSHVDKVHQQFSTHPATLRQVSATLRQSAQDFHAAKTRAVQAQQQAAQLGLVIDRHGSVNIDPTRVSANISNLPVAMASAELIGNEITSSVHAANRADQHAAHALAQLTPGSVHPMASAGSAVPLMVPPGDTGALYPPASVDLKKPDQVKKWWDGLSQPDKKALADQYPQQIGSLDGIPCAVRDYSNRMVLAAAMTRTQSQIDNLQNSPPQPSGNPYAYRADMQRWHDQINALQSKMNGLNAVNKYLGDSNGLSHGYDDNGFPVTDVPQTDPTQDGRPPLGDPNHPPKFLLGIDDTGTGRWIASAGNPDAADHIVTTVPGVGRGLNDHTGEDVSNNNATTTGMRDQGAAPGKSAQIMWSGYEAPQNIVPPPSLDQAKAAAPALESFQHGLVATHQGPAPHMTVVGHSYGSDVVTETTQDGHKLVADDVVLIGSPGVPVEHAYEITQNMIPSHPGMDRYPPTQVWSSAAGKDLIAHTDVLGHDPTSSQFGAHPFASDKNGDHGGYWQTMGLANMANIELGNYDKVLFEKPW